MLRNISLSQPEIKTPAQVKEFTRAQEIMTEVTEVADLFLAQDHSPADLHSADGHVGLENAKLAGKDGTFTGVVEGTREPEGCSCGNCECCAPAASELKSANVEHSYHTESGGFISMRTYHTENLRLEANGNCVTYTVSDTLSQRDLMGDSRTGTITETVIHHLDTDRICYEKQAGDWKYKRR